MYAVANNDENHPPIATKSPSWSFWLIFEHRVSIVSNVLDRSMDEEILYTELDPRTSRSRDGRVDSSAMEPELTHLHMRDIDLPTRRCTAIHIQKLL